MAFSTGKGQRIDMALLDSLITALQVLPFEPEIAREVVARAEGDADERELPLERDAGDGRQRPVPPGHSERVGVRLARDGENHHELVFRPMIGFLQKLLHALAPLRCPLIIPHVLAGVDHIATRPACRNGLWKLAAKRSSRCLVELTQALRDVPAHG